MKLDGLRRTLHDAYPAFDTILRANWVGFALLDEVDLTGTDLRTVFAPIAICSVYDRIHLESPKPETRNRKQIQNSNHQTAITTS